ncbi:helix-turn-helix domain-containing protein [Neobacillus sp. 19]
MARVVKSLGCNHCDRHRKFQDHFRKAKQTLRSIGTLSIDFENYLRLSKVEPAFYDFKQGFYTLAIERQLDENSFEKITHNIAALANLGKNRVGWLFIGVTDREEHTQRIEKLDNITASRIGDFGIVGLEREAKLKNVSLDQYISFIADKISNSPLPDNLKSNIVSKMHYKGNSVLVLEIKCGDDPCWYGPDMYVRAGGHCKKITGQEVGQVFARFK